MAAVSGKLLPRKIADILKAYRERHWADVPIFPLPSEMEIYKICKI